LCPVDAGGPGGRVWAGCVAVCMAQVMKYWNYPNYGSGQHSYESYPYGTQSANFAETYYDWGSMPNSLSSGNIAVATLMYHCGVAVNMHYAPDGSGAFMGSAASALINYFDYAPDVQLVSKYSYSETAWDSVLKTELDLGRPISYAGGSHAFNIDGYQGDNHYHLNWGWGGSYNGYFYLTALNPGGYNFTSGQQAIIHIRPGCGLSDDNLVTKTAYSGSISDNGGTLKNYINCSETKTLISPPGIPKIKLMFSEFKTVEGQDTLYVYDGENQNAPLLMALTGNHDPFEILSSGTKLFLKFKSDSYTTDKGYIINYISAFDDTGISGFVLPKTRTCGISNDSIMVVVKNFGINTKSSIPVTVKVNSPAGTLTYNKSLTKSLITNQYDTLFIGYINTTIPGNYQYTCYTRTTGDNLINSNDTLIETVVIKEIQLCPFSENLEGLDYQMGDWRDLNYRTWINMENERGNAFFRAYVGGGETGGVGGDRDNQNPFLIYDRKIGPITPDAFLYFDYRILAWEQVPVPKTLNTNQKIKILVSSDCGNDFDTIFTIDSSNHVSDAAFKQVKIALGQYNGQNIIIGLTTSWDNEMSSVDYDNFFVVDSVNATFSETFSVEEYKPEIYPNPVSSFLTVKNVKHSEKTTCLSILDISGKKLKEVNVDINDDSVKLDVADLPSGIYFIRIYSNQKVIYGKFCKD